MSAAYALREHSYQLVEKESVAGGLCRSVRTDGFTFDFTGHLLHMKRPDVRELVFGLLGEQSFTRIDRRSAVYSNGTITDYPFQVNTHGLPKNVVRKCVMGFAATLQRDEPLECDPSFARWALATFGQGICDHFMFPYNEKLFCADLETMTADWVSWSIPKPTWSDVVRGALGTNTRAFGYNPTFLYPMAGGIDHLPNAFLPWISAPVLSTSVVSIKPERREATLSNGDLVRYSTLISTVPLPSLVRSIDGAPRDIVEAAQRLRYVSVLNVNVGFDAPSLLPHHWLYFPEQQFPFYRVGVYSNLCPSTVPSGASAFYVEVSHSPGDEPETAALEQRVITSLRDLGFVSRSARLRCVLTFRIPCGYVIHDRHRREALPEIASYLEHHGILTAGRYGAWEYSAMEDAIWHGLAAAERAIG